MFFVVEMSDTVRIQPWLFNVNQEDAISVELNKKLANKVFYNVGLCICLFDIIEIKDSYIFPGDGATHTRVKFRYVVFRPFIDEVMVGKIKSCSREGVTITMGFFDDIIVPPTNMQQPSQFDEKEQLWIWEYETEDGGQEKMFMDVGEEIRFRVVAEHFIDTTPSSTLPGNQANAPETSNEEAKTKIPYSIEASTADSGLGLLSWWG